jgi:hypothetical protein
VRARFSFVIARAGRFSPVFSLREQNRSKRRRNLSDSLLLRVADDKPAGELNPKGLLAGYFPFLLTHILLALIVGAGMILLIARVRIPKL